MKTPITYQHLVIALILALVAWGGYIGCKTAYEAIKHIGYEEGRGKGYDLGYAEGKERGITWGKYLATCSLAEIRQMNEKSKKENQNNHNYNFLLWSESDCPNP